MLNAMVKRPIQGRAIGTCLPTGDNLERVHIEIVSRMDTRNQT